MSRGFDSGQHAYSQSYNGNNKTHAAHYNSVNELSHFGVSRRNYQEDESNYRNVSAFTNQSVHNRIDNLLLESHGKRAQEINGFSYTSGGKHVYVSPQQMRDRVYHKIDAAKATGAMDNARYQNYLRSTANRLDMDMRVFNGC